MENNTKKTKVFYNSEIPSDWEVKKLGKLGNVVSGLTYSPDDICEETGVLVLRSSNVQGGRVTFDDNVFVKVNAGNFNPVKKSDILICVRNGSKSLIGKCALINEDADGKAFGAFMAIFRGDYNEYLIHVFNTDIYNREIHRNLGATINSINGSDLKEFKIPLPPLPEQKAIARVLSTADSAIHTTEKLIAQKQQRKKWLIQNLLTGKKRLNGFEGEWNLVQISELFTPVDRYVEWNENELYNLISIRRRNGGVFFREPLFGYQIGVKKLKTVANNDFVVSKRQASHGAWAVIDQVYDQSKVSGEYDTLEISDLSLLSVDFWKWYCQIPILTHYANVDSDGVHIEKSIFDYDLFKRRKVFIPSSIKEQIAIAQILQSVDKEISLLKAKAEKLREQKKGLMQQLLTGKVRLNVKE